MTKQVVLLEKERMSNELNFLKAQINPHSLFNSLNTVYGSIDKNNPYARRILLQYSELLRYQLYDCTAEKAGIFALTVERSFTSLKTSLLPKWLEEKIGKPPMWERIALSLGEGP